MFAYQCMESELESISSAMGVCVYQTMVEEFENRKRVYCHNAVSISLYQHARQLVIGLGV